MSVQGYSVKLLKQVLSYAKNDLDRKFKLSENVTGNWFGNVFTGREWLDFFKQSLHTKINRNELRKGRKDTSQYEKDMRKAQRLLHDKDKRIIRHGHLPFELRKRFAHLIFNEDLA